MGIGSDIGGILGRELGNAGEGLARSFLGFKKGGRVPGKKGAPKKAIVHGGEYVLPVGVAPTKAQKNAVAKLKKKKM
jgi:hypothetical protein